MCGSPRRVGQHLEHVGPRRARRVVVGDLPGALARPDRLPLRLDLAAGRSGARPCRGAEDRARDRGGPRPAGALQWPPYRPGAIAQLGERLHGMQEVGGSSPASSTRRTPANVGVSSLEGSGCRMRIAILRFWPGLWPDLGSGDPIQPGLRPRRAAVLERLIGRLRSPRRGARLASSAADEEVVEGASDLLAIAALEDLRVRGAGCASQLRPRRAIPVEGRARRRPAAWATGEVLRLAPRSALRARLARADDREAAPSWSRRVCRILTSSRPPVRGGPRGVAPRSRHRRHGPPPVRAPGPA